MISRTNDAPVAAASAIELIGSQWTSTPKGTLISARSAPTTYAIDAVDAVSTSNSYGRSFSLPNITASKPAACSTARSLRAPSQAAIAAYTGCSFGTLASRRATA